MDNEHELLAFQAFLQITVPCANRALLCVVDEDGNMWTPGATPPMAAKFYPHCKNGGKHTYGTTFRRSTIDCASPMNETAIVRCR